MVLNLLRTHRWIRVGLSGLSVALLLGGLGLVGYPFFTNMWQTRIQARLDDQLASPELKQAYMDRKVETGDSLTRIRIPAIGIDVVVVEGITPSALRAGAGHYPQTPLPCETGNVAIAGHRTTYGRPFDNLDQLRPGDTIDLVTPIGACQYEITGDKGPFITAPDDLSVISPTAEKFVTLTTCHPRGSAAQRLIVQAKFVKDLALPA